MLVKDFISNYDMHDSLIDKLEIQENNTIIITIDFAFWMQAGYNESDPETGPLIVTFINVSNYQIPENVSWDEVSILDMHSSDNKIIFFLNNDLTDDYLEIVIECNEITVKK